MKSVTSSLLWKQESGAAARRKSFFSPLHRGRLEKSCFQPVTVHHRYSIGNWKEETERAVRCTDQRPPRKEKEFFGSVAQQRQLATSIRREGGANLEKGIFWAWKRWSNNKKYLKTKRFSLPSSLRKEEEEERRRAPCNKVAGGGSRGGGRRESAKTFFFSSLGNNDRKKISFLLLLLLRASTCDGGGKGSSNSPPSPPPLASGVFMCVCGLAGGGRRGGIALSFDWRRRHVFPFVSRAAESSHAASWAKGRGDVWSKFSRIWRNGGKRLVPTYYVGSVWHLCVNHNRFRHSHINLCWKYYHGSFSPFSFFTFAS